MEVQERKAQQLLSEAKTFLLRRSRFWASIVLSMPTRLDGSQPTMCTNGRVIGFNPDFVLKRSVSELAFILAHEGCHVALLHHLRLKGRQHELANVACDFAIDPIIASCGLTPPKDAHIDPALQGNWEHIYELLLKENEGKMTRPEQNDGNQGGSPQQDGQESKPGEGEGKPGKDGNGGSGDAEESQQESELTANGKEVKRFDEVRSPQGTSSQDADHAEEMRIKSMVRMAAAAQSKAGSMPSDLELLVKSVLEPKIDWRAALSAWAADVAYSDYSWNRPNRRYVQRNIYLPSLYSRDIRELVVIGDTSGSMVHALNEMSAEFEGILRMNLVQRLRVIYVDTEVAGEQEFESGESVELKAQGGGGTSFRPGFEYIEERGYAPVGVVYITDGCCSDFPKMAPSYQVLWTIIDGYGEFKPPFGEVIHAK